LKSRVGQPGRSAVKASNRSRIAGDLTGQRAATIAPMLQILLTQMWRQVEAGPAARFTLELYEGMKRRGLLLDDFLEEQLRALRGWRPEAVDSGLVLDLLFFHTTPLGTAESRSAAEVAERYGHRPEITELVGHARIGSSSPRAGRRGHQLGELDRLLGLIGRRLHALARAAADAMVPPILGAPTTEPIFNERIGLYQSRQKP